MNKEELKELAATLNGIADGKEYEVYSHVHDGIVVERCDASNIMHWLGAGWKIRLKPWSLPPPPDGMQWHRDDWTEEMLPEGWRPLLRGEPRVLGDEFLFDQYERSSEWIDCGGPPATPNSPDVNWCHHRTKRPLPQPDPYAELKAAHAAGKVIQFNPGDSLGWRDQQCDFTAAPHCYRIKPEEPWAAEKAAFAAGETIQYTDDNNYYGEWRDCFYPFWVEADSSNVNARYRIKPKQQKVPFQPSDVLPFCVFRFKGFNDLLTPFCVKDERVYFFSDTSHCWGYEWLMRNAEINRSIPLTGKWNPEAWEFCYKLIDTP